MYVPATFAAADPAEIDAMLGGARLWTLTTQGPEGLFASHLPLIYDAGRRTLAGHLARANPHRSLAGDGPALAIHLGPDAYVSPSWYPSKAEHGRVVPTWNYESVHIYGRLAWIDDPAWILANVSALTDRFEAGMAEPWRVADAPADYVEWMARGVVGVELAIERIDAKRKLSQNRSEADQAGVVAGLEAAGEPAVAAAMKRRAP